MNTLFIIALLVQICVRNGFIIQQYSSFKTKLYDIDKNYFGTEYDLEMTPYEKNPDMFTHLFTHLLTDGLINDTSNFF